jgi:hypothetical protein
MNIKDVEIAARVTKQMREALLEIAEREQEGISVVVRRALREYLANRESSLQPNESNYVKSK